MHMRSPVGAAVVGTVATVLLVSLLASCAPSGGASSEVTIRVLAVEGPETDALASEAAAFSEESGISVEVDAVARDVWGQRKVAELSQDAGAYDIVFVGGGDDTAWMLQHANVQDLTSYLGEEVIGDVVNNELFTREDGAFVGVPQYYNFPMTYYRIDLFEDPAEQSAFLAQYGYELAPPTTFDQLVDIATFFNRPPELYGTCLGGVDWSIFLDNTYFTYGLGSNYGDLTTGELTLDTPEQVQALEYIKALTELSAPGWEALNFFDCDAQMQAGTVAIYQNWLYAWASISQTMPDMIALAPPAGEQTHLGAMLATIPEAAPNPEAAGEFIAWMISDAFQLPQAEATGNLPVRQSQQDSADFAAVLPELDMLKTVGSRLAYNHTTWAGELSAGVAEAIAKVNNGEMTAEEAVAWLQDDKFAGRKALE
jgi:multiple sugar transport system substrate-binding protein